LKKKEKKFKKPRVFEAVDPAVIHRNRNQKTKNTT